MFGFLNVYKPKGMTSHDVVSFMRKIAVIYWSGTGNTQMMAEAVTEGAKGAGAASQIAIGTSVFFGMILATLVGIVFIPALFALFDTFASRFAPPPAVSKARSGGRK